MDNLRLAKLSEKFYDNDANSVIRHCFLLMAGQDEIIDSGFTLKASANIFDDPDVVKVIDVKIRLEMFVIETFPDLI